MSLVEALCRFWLRVAWSRRIVQQSQEFAPGLPLPGLVALKPRVEKREGKVRFYRLALNELKQGANIRLRFSKLSASLRPAGRRLRSGSHPTEIRRGAYPHRQALKKTAPRRQRRFRLLSQSFRGLRCSEWSILHRCNRLQLSRAGSILQPRT